MLQISANACSASLNGIAFLFPGCYICFPKPIFLKLQKPIRYVLLLILAGILYLVVFTYQNIQRHKEATYWVTHTHEVIENISDVRASLLDVESQLRGYVITSNGLFTKGYNRRKETLLQQVAQLRRRTSDNPGQQKNGLQLQRLCNEKLAFQTEILLYNEASQQEAFTLIAKMKGKQLTDAIENVLQSMKLQEQALLAQRIERSRQLTQMRYTTTIILALVSIVVLAVLLMKIATEARLRRMAEHRSQLNEHKYKGLIENLALVVYTTDLDGKFIYLSGKCKDLTGFTAEELIGENFLAMVDESWRRKVQEFYLAQKEKRTFETTLELPIVGKSGELRWIEQSVVLLEEKGQATGFQSIAKDVTERKYAEMLLADAEQRIKAKQDEYQERLQAILDNMPMIVYLKDLEGKFMMVNRQFHDTFGTTDKGVIGKTGIDVHQTKEDSERFEEADSKVKRTGRPVEIEGAVLTRQGERNMLIVKFPLFDKNNQLVAISAVGKDITELMRYQRQLIAARQRAEKAERLQEEFLANMSHEIRTPMNGIIGMTNLLETTTLNTEQREYLHLIQESSGILLALINDILDLSKIKSGRMSVEKADYNLHQTIDSIIAPFKVKAKQKGIRVTRILEDVPVMVSGDQHKLQQVLNNLLSNAVKFTTEGAVTLFATTEQRQDALYLVCSVSDTGIGIAPENLEQVFESFVQAGNDMVRRFGGTGLGLAITRRLVELQHGQISVSSVLGEGSSFYFELPLVVSNNMPATKDNTPLQEQKELSACALKGKKILLIEDNLVNQKVTYLMLHKAGMLVDIANHGREAIALLEKKTYDLIITDLQMPEMDGFQTVAYIRNKLHLSIPIIAMTASALRNEKDRCLELGMNEYLTKPFSPTTLFYHLNRLLAPEENRAEKPAVLPEEKPQELYNLSFLEEMDDADYAAEVLELFLSSTPVALAGIKEAAFREEWTEVYKKAHSLKSSLGILQLHKMLQTVTEIESLARRQAHTENIESLLQHAVQQYGLVKPMLEAELQSTREKLVL